MNVFGIKEENEDEEGEENENNDDNKGENEIKDDIEKIEIDPKEFDFHYVMLPYGNQLKTILSSIYNANSY